MVVRYYIDKISNTSADTLLAIGFALLLQEVLQGCKKPYKGIRICDAGPYYEVQIPTTITDNDLQQLPSFTLVKPIVTETQTKSLQKQGKDLDGFDYQRQKERVEQAGNLAPEMGSQRITIPEIGGELEMWLYFLIVRALRLADQRADLFTSR